MLSTVVIRHRLIWGVVCFSIVILLFINICLSLMSVIVPYKIKIKAIKNTKHSQMYIKLIRSLFNAILGLHSRARGNNKIIIGESCETKHRNGSAWRDQRVRPRSDHECHCSNRIINGQWPARGHWQPLP